MFRRCVFCALTVALFGTAFFELHGTRQPAVTPVRITRPVLPAPSPWVARAEVGSYSEKSGPAPTDRIPL